MSGSLHTPSRPRLCRRLLLTLALLPALSVPATARGPGTLTGPRRTLQILVTGRYADGSVRDLTHFCDLTLEQPGVALLDEDRFLLSVKDGATTLIVQAASQTVRVPVTVKDFSKPHPVSFRNDLIAAMNV